MWGWLRDQAVGRSRKDLGEGVNEDVKGLGNTVHRNQVTLQEAVK